MTLSDRHQKSDYQVMEIVVSVFGGTIIFFMTIYSILGIIGIRKSIKNMKKHR